MPHRWKSLGAERSGLGALLALISAVVFVDTVFFTAVTPLLPHYVHALRLSESGARAPRRRLPHRRAARLHPWRECTPAGSASGPPSGGRPDARRRRQLVFGLASSVVLLDLASFVQALWACSWAGGLAWLASAAPVDRRAAALGVAFSAAVGGALFGPVVGAIASRAGTGATFAGATVAGGCLIVASLLVRVPTSDESQSLRSAFSALRNEVSPAVCG